ncbi:RING finger protein 215 isoform X5 [Amblyraja radiata]|uniref:RING finger protein 215 isoform X5 n=1 Tax=Amblyraja radiata TaxID=386614 RepID=UPI0014026D8C|nr:RING finger protein 215 isoform X5 [Amblyraja radiata]
MVDCCWKWLGIYLLLAASLLHWCAAAEKVALVDVLLMDAQRGWSAEFGFKSGSNYRLQGTVLAPGSGQGNEGLCAFPKHNPDSLEGSLILVKDEPLDIQPNKGEKWIGVVSVDEDQVEKKGSSKQEWFAAAVINKMKRALVLGASALFILVLNQNAFTEMDISEVLSKPVVVMQSSENVTKLLGALLSGLRASAKITFKSIIQNDLMNLKQQVLKQLSAMKTRKYFPNKRHKTQLQEHESCAVCLEEFHKNQCLRVLPCLHEFHRDCVDPWLLLQQTCPLCKRNVFGDPCGNS